MIQETHCSPWKQARGLEWEGLGVMEDWECGKDLGGGGACLARSNCCLVGLKPKHAVYLHISIQYIKYSLVFFIQKILFFSFYLFLNSQVW